MGAVLVLTGLVAAAIGTWRGYVNARLVLAPIVHDGEPTRTALEATQSVLARTRVRRAARNLMTSLGWLAVAMYGLFLVATGEVTG
jgi:hypothetical protein